MSLVRRYWVLGSGIVLLVWGITSEITFVTSTTSFGWTAYAPLTSTTFAPTSTGSAGLVEVLAGAVLIAGWIGYRLGRRAEKQS